MGDDLQPFNMSVDINTISNSGTILWRRLKHGINIGKLEQQGRADSYVFGFEES